jgi:glycerate 2-kinase
MPVEMLDHNMARDLRDLVRRIFLTSLADSGIDKAFTRHIDYERGILRIGEDLYDLSSFSRVFAISIGKAAHPMASALMTTVGAGAGVSGIVATPVDQSSQIFAFRYFLGGHPTPNHESVRAAEAILRSLQTLTARSLVIYMISGGGSSVVETPISSSISLPDLIATYQALVHSGAPIAEINTVRKHLSAVKGGRMALVAAPAQQVSIMVSDVPDDSLDALASGPTMPDSSTVEQCHSIVRDFKLLNEFPASVRELFHHGGLDETPKEGDPAFAHSRWVTVLSNATARKAAVTGAAASGFAVEVDNACDDWDYARAADYLLEKLRKLRSGVSRVCLISGGEVTVKVSGKPGSGGRNQQFALYCAQKIAGERIVVLSAGTDGVDGNSTAAGAIVDGTTVHRAREKGIDPAQALARFDAYPLFTALGDDVTTGPTGNNLRDLRILLAY